MATLGYLPFLISRSAHAVRRLVAKSLADRQSSVTPEEAMAVLLIGQFGDRTVSKLAEGLGRDRTTVTRLLDALEKKGYVLRESAPDDRRSTVVSLSEAGLKFEAIVAVDNERMVEKLVDGIDPVDLEVTLAVLRTIQARAGSLVDGTE
jgi:DNA-binding MarR family transcriptional regulator